MQNSVKYIKENNPQVFAGGTNKEKDLFVLLCTFPSGESRKIVIKALPVCCDVNTFIFSTNQNIKGMYITDIFEDPNDEEGEELYFNVHILCTYKPIINLLRESYLFRKLPKDIFNMISEKIGKDVDYVFQRKNESNGWYRGCIEINII